MIHIHIAIIDADLISRPKHRFPNLACMKISGYLKSKNKDVELITDYGKLKEKQYEKIYMSKVFTDTKVPEWVLNLPNIKYGGTGFFYDKADPLPQYIEHHKPDYHLYDDWVESKIKDGDKPLNYKYYTDYSIGFTTRGCFRKCEFCVNKNYRKVELHSPIEEFIDQNRKYICLLDDNILGFSNWNLVLDSLRETGKRFEYKQGMDMRLMTEEKAKTLSSSKYIGDYIFAFDNITDRDLIEKKLQLWRRYCSKTTKLYVFCGYDRNNKWDYDFWIQDIKDTFERIKILMKYGCLPYIMRYDKYKESPYYGTYISLARWCNQPNFYKKVSYRRYCEMNQEKIKNKICSAIIYLNKLEDKHPEIAKKYFDMRFEDILLK